MKTRRHVKTVVHDENEGASTSYDQSSVRGVPSADNDDSYHFPTRLVKDRHWKETALSVKNNSEVTHCIDVTTVFDFFNKLGAAFNLTAVTEQELDDAIVAERSSPHASILVKMVVELISGFSSVDYSHTVRMYQRNKIYHETNADNYNQSLWTFYSHDWKFMDMERWQVDNILGPSKENADFFALPFRLRSALLVDLCMYRISCPNAQDMIDSIADESKRSLGSQLRSEPIGLIDNASIYYFGGVRIYRSKVLTRKELSKMRRLNKNLEKRKTDKQTNENDKSEIKSFSETVESTENLDKRSGLLTEKKEEQKMEATLEKGDESVKLEGSTTQLDVSSNSHSIEHLVNQDYFLKLLDYQSTWEVICNTEDDLHYLIEYCRTSRNSAVNSLASILINKVLPSVQRCLRKQREASRLSCRLNGSFQLGEYGLRHSQRLEQKKIERERQLELQKKRELELENFLREQEGKREIPVSNETTEVQSKISREERLRLREQRILEQELAKRRKIEAKLDLNKDVNSESSVENYEPSPSTSTKIDGHCDVMTDQRSENWIDETSNKRDRSEGAKVHRRKQTFDTCDTKTPLHYAQKQFMNIVNSDPSDMNLWKEFNLNEIDVFEKQKQCSSPLHGSLMNDESQSGKKRRYSVLSNSVSPPQFSAQSLSQFPSQIQNRSTIFKTFNDGLRSNQLRVKQSVMLHHENKDASIVGKEFLRSTAPLSTNDCMSVNSKFVSDKMKDTPMMNSFGYCSQGQLVDENTQCTNQESSDNEDCTKIIVTKYLDYPSMENSESFFRIVVPDGSYMTLLASGPLLDHDYIVPPVELIIDQKWKFAADPLEPDSTFQPIEFSLQKQEPVVPADELVDIET